LTLDNNNPPNGCTIRVRNELQNEDVVTLCDLVKKYDGKEVVQSLGILFDRDMKVDGNRVFRGELQNGLATSDDGNGSLAIFVKESGKGLNNVNAAWMDWSTWESSHRVESNDVGQANAGPTENSLVVQWGGSAYAGRKNVALSPVYELDDNGDQTEDYAKYLVTIEGGTSQYKVWINGNYVHFVLDGDRFRINLQTNVVDRLVVRDLPVVTLDFFSTCTPTQLRDSLSRNVKDAMLNQIVQKVIDSTATDDNGSIDI
jgi:hypothetical protein